MAIKYLAGNRLTLLNSGAEYFPALLAAIEAAHSEIFLESYIYANDEVGLRVSNALCRAVARGVVVNVIVDGFGARNFTTDFLPQLTAAGVRAMLYRPELGSFLGRFRLRRHRLRRLHRKLTVIDARLAFIGGINIIDDDNTPPGLRPRYDYAVRVEGPLLGPIHHAVQRMWEIVAWVNFKHRYRLPSPTTPDLAPRGSQRAALLIRDNIRHRNDILHAYVDAFAAAREEILIANAYFLPGVRFIRALQAAARRGVRITVLLQGKTNHPLLRSATQALYSLLLEQGIRIFEYEKSFLHAKVAVIDGEWATVGSSNIDPFSLLLAKEANLAVLDRTFAGQLRASIEAAMLAGAREMRREDLTGQPWHSRLRRWLSYGVVRVLVGITGYGQKHWRADEETASVTPEEQ
ncbi:MAG: cardiolipin synthase ClsB [Azonexus sp.]|jgi:cardiolipin synthase|uniref:cardiolipin synthase ClsB n=1 Tax=Azonexus sp. TaxID=1872668 RepID=UPI00281EDF54|nr:cardiolipin synthase ClsB [Azonexus sp.]MDR0777283.1 cardiolipin synthase ClsB [Azonexus sp.]